MTKPCQCCGAVISTDDYYAFIRTKYCRSCAKEVRRRQKADWARELRRKTRECNALTRELCAAQQEEIGRLRALLAEQRERCRALENELEAYDDRH